MFGFLTKVHVDAGPSASEEMSDLVTGKRKRKTIDYKVRLAVTLPSRLAQYIPFIWINALLHLLWSMLFSGLQPRANIYTYCTMQNVVLVSVMYLSLSCVTISEGESKSNFSA